VETGRRAWLAERLAAVVIEYDRLASTYDQHEYPAPLQEEFARKLVETCPPGGVVLDAPCGTGRYFHLVTEAGRRVVGADQSAGMLAQARARGLAEHLEHVSLQQLSFDHEFDAAMAIDAMENVPPEDWPVVLANLHRAVRRGCHVYLTVEEADEDHIEAAFESARRRGNPAVRGEIVEGNVAGYHYYPERERVLSWLADEGLAVIEEAVDRQPGWGYRHFLVRTA
jgi:ubiquinone/menaquinone biosynthesis C-methylase UbiE